MAWLPKSASELPHVIVGPMLRKVTTNQVSVMVVTKVQCDARLMIYEYNEDSTVTSVIISDDPLTYQPLRSLGANCFLGVITVYLPTNLSRNKTYGYNIKFKLADNSEFTLEDDNIIGNIGEVDPMLRISYGQTFNINGSSKPLPTFILPPAEVKNLRILHGSCRKPHGEGVDAMSNIDAIINDGINTLDHQRPHMLFLTGDQIYADDVSQTMLYMIDKYAIDLLGWDEDLGIVGADVENLAPGKRSNNIKDIANFSAESDDVKSHLMKLREFIVMYLMIWSNSLWSVASDGILQLPDFEEVYPDSSPTNTEYYTNSEGVGSVSITINSKEFEEYMIDKSALIYFSLGLNIYSISRALANIPVYMILDDHEVTDDLFYNANWYTSVIENSNLGKRIITNGMAAYALFQDWGNKPEDYIDGPGLSLLNSVNNIVNNPSVDSEWNLLSDIVLPILDSVAIPNCLRHAENSLNWHYYYSVGNNYEFIVLDSRTMRVFNHGNDGIPGLMSDEAMTIQIEDNADESERIKTFVFVICPTPVIGVNRIEKNKMTASLLKDKKYLDIEHWSYDQKVYEHFFSKLISRNPTADSLQVVLMGGDVHYGYTSQMHFWAMQSYAESYMDKYIAIAGLCASSFKNETGPANASPLAYFVGAFTTAFQDVRLTKWNDKSVNFGWRNTDHSADLITVTLTTAHDFYYSRSPHIFFRNEIILEELTDDISSGSPLPTEEWQYRIEPVYSPEVNFMADAITGFSLESVINHMGQHQDYVDYGAGLGRFIVGVNNHGDISFEADGTITKAIHKLWWWNKKNMTLLISGTTESYTARGYPHTKHEIDMKTYVKPQMNIL